MRGRSNASLGTQQAAVIGPAALLRVDPLRAQGFGGGASCGVSTSCGSLWFIDAGRMAIPEPSSISPRFLSQDDRIAIADGLAAKLPVKEIAAGIGKSFQTVYREIARGSKPDGRYQPWWAHNQALLRRRRPKSKRILVGSAAVAGDHRQAAPEMVTAHRSRAS